MESKQNDLSNDVVEQNHGNTGLPFGLCEKYGIAVPKNAMPRQAWNLLKKYGIVPPWEDKGGEQWVDGKHTMPKKDTPEPKKTAYDIIENQAGQYKIHGETITAKPYSLVESWINVSKRGYGYYFGIDVDGKKYFVSIDPKTANDRRWIEPSILGYKNMKISANGYVYIDSKGYANFVIKDLNNFSKI